MAFRATGELRTLAQLMSEQGYRTAGFVSAAPLKAFSGISAGFEAFDQPEEESRHAGATNEVVLDWMSRTDDGAPFFLWVHYFDPHRPYLPPPPFLEKYETGPELETYFSERAFSLPDDKAVPTDVMNNRYDGEVSYVDREIGELLEALRSNPDRWSDTILVVVADHGEGLRQHGEVAHGSVWEEQLRVPLMIRWPGAVALS